jgi:biotin synthase-like enzyme
MNIRSGLCSEDCKWCAQSIKHKTNINIYPILDIDKVLDCAVKNHVKGINRFSLVTSGRKVEKNEILKISEIYKHIRKDTNGTSSINNTIERILQTKPLHLCASMGLIGKEEMLILKNAGVSRYHCNLETSPSFFSKLCSTHTFEEKKQTLLLAKECGLEICSGGIIGMGESMEQRIELAFELRSLGVKSVPMNILNPIKGTELENAIPLSEEEILTTIAIFRFVLPNAFIRFAGGRIKMSEELQRKALKTGINASVVGDLLTTAGTDIEKDFEMFKELGYEITKQKMEFPQKT